MAVLEQQIIQKLTAKTEKKETQNISLFVSAAADTSDV